MLQFSHASKLSAFLLVFLCAFLFAGNVSAQEDDARMKELVKQGTQAFSEKRYADAASLFERAYEAKSNPTLLKNAMVAWYKGNDCDKALHVGARYYREASDAGQLEAKDQSEIQTVISCSLNLAKQRIDENEFTEAEDLLFTATSAGPTSEQTERIAKLRDDLRSGREAVASGGSGDPNNGTGDSSGAGSDTGTTDTSSTMSPIAITGWAFTGAGVVGLIGSVIYGLTAASDERSAVSSCDSSLPSGGGSYLPFYRCLDGELGTSIAAADANQQASLYQDSVQDPIESAQGTSVILYSVSGAVTAIGVGILVYHYFLTDSAAEASSETVTATPTFGQDSVGAQLQWRF